MGVKGLWQLLDSIGRPVNCENLQCQTVAIDVSLWIHQAIRVTNASKTAHLETLLRRIAKLWFYQIKPIFVFDGPNVPIFKRQTLSERRMRREIAANRLENARQKMLLKHLEKEVLSETSPSKNSTRKPLKLPKLPLKYSDEGAMYDIPSTSSSLVSSLENDCSDYDEDDEYLSDDSEEENFISAAAKSQRKLLASGINLDIFNELPLQIQQSILNDLDEETEPAPNASLSAKCADDFSSSQMQKLLQKANIKREISKAKQSKRFQNKQKLLANGGLEMLDCLDNVEVAGMVKQSKERFVLFVSENKSDSFLSSSSASSNAADEETPVKKLKTDDESAVMLSDDESSSPTSEFVSPSFEEKFDEILQNEVRTIFKQENKAKNRQKPSKKLSFDSSETELTEEIKNDPIGKMSGDDVIFIGSAQVEAPMPKVHAESPKLEVCFETLRSKVRVEAPMPKVHAESPKLEVCFEPLKLSANDEPVKSKVHVEVSKPKVHVEASKPKVHVEASKPKVKVHVESPELEVCFEAPKSKVHVEASKPNAHFDPQNGDDSSSDDFVEVDDVKIISDDESQRDVEIVYDSFSSSKTEIFSNSGEIQRQKIADPKDSKNQENPMEKFLNISNEFRSSKSNFPHMSEVSVKEKKLDDEINSLIREQQTNSNVAVSLSDQLYSECQELLKICGLPYVIASGEAEAQCAWLENSGFVHGILTEDSDVWLFGASRMYKNLFSKSESPLLFKSNDAQSKLGLDRRKMILIAILCGCDYTQGVEGIGPVTALEIIAEFGKATDENVESLQRFREWHEKTNSETFDDFRPGNEVRARLLKMNLIFPDSFPNKAIFDCFLKPTVDESDERFKFGNPDLPALRNLAVNRFGWTRQKFDDFVLPAVKKWRSGETQTQLTSFLSKAEQRPAIDELKLSKRLQAAFEKLKNSPNFQIENKTKTKGPVKAAAAKKSKIGTKASKKVEKSKKSKKSGQ